MDRKPIFDAVRTMLGHRFSADEIAVLDRACDLAEIPAAPRPTPAPPPSPSVPVPALEAAAAYRLGALSEEYESGNRGPGAVSGGLNDPGGVSYGCYQLASKTGTCAAFVKTEGKPWAQDFAAHKPGTAAFSAAWQAVARREEAVFRLAQHAFVERTHYRPAVMAVDDRKGLDLDGRHNAVRDATWSVAVQHAGAANILIDAVGSVDAMVPRDDAGYDRRLVEAIYRARTAYVLQVAASPGRSPGERAQLVSITKVRYVAELKKALAMINAIPSADVSADGTIDGNAVAAALGVAVKGPTVQVSRLHPKLGAAIAAVADEGKALGLPKAVITSGNDSTHMQGSAHYANRALDFRGNDIEISVGQAWRDAVAKRLGNDYDVIFETFVNLANNHLHVEYDPD